LSSKDRFAYFQAPGQQFKRSIQLFASKSELIRAFHLKSFEPGLQVMGESFAEDVLTAQKAYSDFLQGSADFFVGESGALLRFLLFRVSRRPGRYSIRGAPSLFSRPHQEARNILAQLGIELEMKKKSIEVVSQGWRKPSKPVRVSLSMSSQFLSGLILSSLDLDFEFEVWIEGPKVSESYFRITIAMLDHLGIKLKIFDEKRIIIPKNQRIQSAYYVCDWDWSSIFTLAAYAARGGALEVPWCWSLESIIHPDVAFIKIFKEMGILA
jgi:3-phosphoshikimate 1-carboxyvinyltransferase